MHLSFHPDSFTSINELSKSPKLSQYVKTVLYDYSVLRQDMSREEWESRLRLPDPCELPPHPRLPYGIMTPANKQSYLHAVSCWAEACYPKNLYGQQELATGWGNYRKLCQDIQDLKKSTLDSTLLASSFARFPNLNEVKVLVSDIPLCDMEVWSAWNENHENQYFEHFESSVFKLALVQFSSLEIIAG